MVREHDLLMEALAIEPGDGQALQNWKTRAQDAIARDQWKAGTGQRIDKLYAWIAREEDGGEGLVAAKLPNLGWLPLVGADRERMESLRELAMNTARGSHRPVRLKVFSRGVTIDEIDP
jgi:hypothetical protein